MKVNVTLLCIALFLGSMANGQIKIGDNPQNIDGASVLELESNSRVLVITRITTSQMESIVPNPGALVYNTDTQCIHYYDGTQWLNLCESADLNFTTDPIENDLSTIVITENNGTFNFEVAPNSIRTEQIVNGGVNGVDIQDNSIGPNKLTDDAVGRDEISENAVGVEALAVDEFSLADFANTPGFITGANIVSGAPNNAITDNGGAFYDDNVLENNIQANTNALILKEDTANKSNDPALGNSAILFPTQNAVKTYVDAAVGGSAQTIVSGNTPNSIVTGTDGGALFNAIPLQNDITTNTNNLAAHIATDDTDDTNEFTDLVFDNATSILTLARPATVGNQVDLSGLSGGGGTTELADQLTIVGNGQAGDEFEVADNAISNAKLALNAVQTGNILNSNVTEAKLAPGGADQILRTNAAGTAVTWVDFPATVGSTEEADQITITGVGTNLDPFKIEPGANGQYLSTTGGNVIWDNLPGGTGGTVEVDGITIEGNGVTPNPLQVRDDGITTAKILDGNVTNTKIAPGGANQILRTNATGTAVAWVDLTGIGTTELADQITITGDGTVGNEFQVADDAITTARILDGEVQTGDIADDNVTPAKIAQGAAGEVLTTNGTGDVVWAAATAGAVATDATLDGDGSGTPLSVADDAITTARILDGEVQTGDIADDNVTPAKIAQGAAGEVLTTNGTGDVVWAAATAGAVATDATLDGDGSGTPLSVADDAITTARILDGEVQTGDIADDNVTPAKIAQGAAGEVLTTNGTGDVVWAAATAGAVATDATLDGDGSGTPLSVADDAITTARILDGEVQTGDIADDNVTPAKIAQGAAGEVLTTNGTGDVVWAAATAGAVATDATLDGDGSGTPLSVADDAITTARILDGEVQTGDIADDNVTPAKIAQGAAGEVLTTNGTGDVVWAAATGGGVNLQDNDLTLFEDRTVDLVGNDLSFDGAGFVGIGTDNPQNKLHVTAAVRADGGFRSTFGTLPSSVAFSFDNDSDTGMYRAAANQLGFVTAGIEAVRINALGEVGISVNPAFTIAARLHVDGNILAEGDLLTNGDLIDQTPDFVFQKYYKGYSSLNDQYEFKSLEEIEAFVRKNHHLPGIKSAAQVKADGVWNLSDSNLQNLEKIEELFLHTIAQEKKIDQLQHEKDTLSQEVQRLRRDLEAIKALLQTNGTK